MSPAQRNQKLIYLLRQYIQKHGPMSFDKWMNAILYSPNIGYYNNIEPPFGASGDYITLPMKSALFGQCVGSFVLPLIHQLSSRHIIEIGPGTGVLAADIISTCAQAGQSLRYDLLELNPKQRQKQHYFLQQCLPHLSHHFSHIHQIPNNFKGIIIANEWLDALPVHLFLIHQKQFYEREIIWENGGFAWHDHPKPCPSFLKTVAKQDYYLSEYSSIIPKWMHYLSSKIASGGLLLFDYGYTHANYYTKERDTGTLRAFYKQRIQDNILDRVGLQDLTAHINFSLVVEQALQAGFELDFFIPQALFLLLSGEKLIQQANIMEKMAFKSVLYEESSHAFQALFLSKGCHLKPILKPYQAYDRRASL